MGAKKFIVTIPEPCTENWGAMTPVEKGRFCGACQKTVTDFSVLSDSEIVAVLKNLNSNNMCGRFHTAQMNREIEELLPKRFSARLLQRIAAAFLFFQTITTAAWAQLAKPKEQRVHVTPGSQKAIKSGISGYVKDYVTNEPVMDIEVRIAGTNITAVADPSGYFLLPLPDTFGMDNITIKAVYTLKTGPEPAGTTIPEQTITIDSLSQNLITMLYRYPVDRTDGGKVATYAKPLIDRYGGFVVLTGATEMKPNFYIYWPFCKKNWPFSKKNKRKHE